MGTLVPADATRDKRSMLNSQVAALEGCTFLRASISGARHLARTALGDSQVMPAGAPSSRHTRSLVLPDSQLTHKKRPIRPKETTRRVRHTATPSHLRVPARAAATALARRLPLATPSSAAPVLATSTTACLCFRRSRLQCTGVHDAAPVCASVSSVPSWKTIAHLVIHFNNPNTPTPRPPIKPLLAACKTLAQQAQGPLRGVLQPERYILLGRRTHTSVTRGTQLDFGRIRALRTSQV